MIFNLYDEKVKYINRDLAKEEGMTIEKVEGMPLLDIIHSFIHRTGKKPSNFIPI